VGYLDLDANLVGESIGGSDVLGVVDDISAVLKANVIDEVILAIPRAMISDVEKIAYVCEEEGVRFRIMADVFNVQVPRMELVYFGSLPLLTLHPVVQEEWKVLVKRIVDLAITILLLPAVLALTAAIAVAIRLDTEGPVFFVQERVGLKKRLFRMYKFRTMVVGSEKMMKEIEGKNEAEGPIFKIAHDPRITRVGKFLRRTSLDELPQVFNVLRGDMSLVGPRPMSVRDVSLFDKGIQRKRFSVKPGITCLWQVSGRSLLPFSKWLELDLYYISNWSLGLDFKILWKTIPAVLRGTGAM
jgi:exopolysaccharide biosynthesis polyprenyl glycosylphosphotransferase